MSGAMLSEVLSEQMGSLMQTLPPTVAAAASSASSSRELFNRRLYKVIFFLGFGTVLRNQGVNMNADPITYGTVADNIGFSLARASFIIPRLGRIKKDLFCRFSDEGEFFTLLGEGRAQLEDVGPGCRPSSPDLRRYQARINFLRCEDVFYGE